MELIVLLGGALAGYGLLLLGSWFADSATELRGAPVLGWRRPSNPRLFGAAAFGICTAIFTRWPVGVVAATLVGYNIATLAAVFFPGRSEIERAEAVAIWVEMLRDVTLIGKGVRDAIASTVDSAPSLIAVSVGNLNERLRVDYRNAAAHYVALGDELSSPTGDLVAMALARFDRGSVGSVSALLGELAVTAREDVGMRRRIMTARRRPQTTVRGVIGVFAMILLAGRLLAPAYLHSYQTATGQVVLALVVLTFACGLWWLIRLNRYDMPERFRLSVPGDER